MDSNYISHGMKYRILVGVLVRILRKIPVRGYSMNRSD